MDWLIEHLPSLLLMLAGSGGAWQFLRYLAKKQMDIRERKITALSYEIKAKAQERAVTAEERAAVLEEKTLIRNQTLERLQAVTAANGFLIEKVAEQQHLLQDRHDELTALRLERDAQRRRASDCEERLESTRAELDNEKRHRAQLTMTNERQAEILRNRKDR